VSKIMGGKNSGREKTCDSTNEVLISSHNVVNMLAELAYT